MSLQVHHLCLRGYPVLILVKLFICLFLFSFDTSQARQSLPVMKGEVVPFFGKGEGGKWGLILERNGKFLFANPEPISIEVFVGDKVSGRLRSGYDVLEVVGDGYVGRSLMRYEEARFEVVDHWKVDGGCLKLARKLEVIEGLGVNKLHGFMSGVTLLSHAKASRDSVELFAPGMIYGGTGSLTKAAIGGSDCTDYIRIREDRLPAPMIGGRFGGGMSITVLNTKPDGRTIGMDSKAPKSNVVVSDGLLFGAVGVDFIDGKSSFGYWFPGSEGGITYKGRTYPHGQLKEWSRRYHAVDKGNKQSYEVSFRVSFDENFADYYSNAWRWAWERLKPQVAYHDIDSVRRHVTAVLAEMTWTRKGATGLQMGVSALKKDGKNAWFNSRMGFAGRALEGAGYLLESARREGSQGESKYKVLGESAIRSFLKLGMSPPEGEGISAGGAPFTKKGRVYLRSLTDGHKELLKSVQREKKYGVKRDAWVAWSRSFADWLIPQQSEEGGFPRVWEHKTGKVLDGSPHSSYNVIGFLVLLERLTGEKKYGVAAMRAGDFCWRNSHSRGIFVGGTSDNPDVIDKEAGTISLEAYLALYAHTGDKKWLTRAKVAAHFAETWIYIWDVPMPEDVDDKDLDWKKGVSTVGLQLIATGHSLVDQYMAYDVDEFAELYLKTGDRHYYDVAMILLHNTKSMLAMPGRDYDLRGAGWKQEHYSLAPSRGVGVNRSWVGWVSTSLLNGIIELEELDKELYEKMVRKSAE